MPSPIAAELPTAPPPRAGALAAVGVFAIGYLAALVLICEMNAAVIIHDAVVGPLFVAALYAAVFAPAAIAGIVALTFKRITRLSRLRLAVSFSVLVAIAVEFLFVNQLAELLSRDYDVLVLGILNAALILTFLMLGRRAAARRSEKPS